ncbi:MAG: 1-deoxy-D-xylulose-5-phosphate synthase [Erysipelotrichaceae bacterium]|nr:1-deoxy-D-xylulose-5-phosphate synthase [Erysipelotrichaceae bacterium]
MNLMDIKNPDFLKQLNKKELTSLAADIRKFIIDNVSKTGGHFSSNLGIVELTIGLHYVFGAPADKFLFDVGHQTYVHKILTGRADRFTTLRQKDGLSGFQKRCESEYDCFEAGHSSTAISAATGMAIARDMNNDHYEIIAVVGDAAMASGESFEALNHLGGLNTKVIIILNDNNMSIGNNVGGMHNLLNDIRVSQGYENVRSTYRDLLIRTARGKKVYRATKRMKDSIRNAMNNDTMFSQLGFDYIGPVDGHNISEIIRALKVAQRHEHSSVIHVMTTKGKGYDQAENDRLGLYHGVNAFDITKGIQPKYDPDNASWSQIVSSHIKYMMQDHKDICVVTPAMKTGSCLNDIFLAYPKRCFDVGIAEEHAMTMTSGIALNGAFPFLSIYSSFLQRAYDQLNHDIARMDCPCLIGIDRADLVGKDGPTHQGVFDIGFMMPIPNLVIMEPSNETEAQMMINTAYALKDHPYVMRYSNQITSRTLNHTEETLEVGQWVYAYKTDEATSVIISYGDAINDIIKTIKDNDLKVNLINARFLKPLDEDMLMSITHMPIIVYERSLIDGSLGTYINDFYIKHQQVVNIKNLAIENHYIAQGTVPEQIVEEHVSMDDLMALIEEIESERTS